MATSEPTNLKANPNQVPSWGRPFAMATAIVFLISSIFPVVAGLSKDSDSFPAWWGRLDVGIAFVLIIMAFIISVLAHGKVNKRIEATTYRLYRILIHAIIILILIFFLLGDRIIWINGLPGIAWRSWLLLYILPEWLSIMRLTTDNPEQNTCGI